MAQTTKKPAKRRGIVIDPMRMRTAAGINQHKFWTKLGVTQSGGSRYESGRDLPKPVRMLLALSSGQATIEQLQSGELAAAL